jgi:hypothetical protein
MIQRCPRNPMVRQKRTRPKALDGRVRRRRPPLANHDSEGTDDVVEAFDKGVISEAIELFDKMIVAIEKGERAILSENIPRNRKGTPDAKPARIRIITVEGLGPEEIERLKAIKSEFVNWFETLVRERTQEMLQHAPDSLTPKGGPPALPGWQ